MGTSLAIERYHQKSSHMRVAERTLTCFRWLDYPVTVTWNNGDCCWKSDLSLQLQLSVLEQASSVMILESVIPSVVSYLKKFVFLTLLFVVGV